jgi:hypothetical protein
MYLACRHIKTNGLRCKSPALKGGQFCYFHARIHKSTRIATFEDFEIPVPEDPISIRLSLARVCNALISGHIDPRRAGQILYALQIAARLVNRKDHFWEEDTVQTATQTSDGDELAPEERICDGNDDCTSCEFAEDCPNYHDDSDDDDDDD